MPDTPTENPRSKELLTFLSAFSKLLNSATGADLTIKVGGGTFNAHQCILGLRTDYFQAAKRVAGASTNAKASANEGKKKDETSTSENNENEKMEFTFEETSPYAVWRFLEYCYTGDYTVDSNDAPEILGEDDDGTLKHVRVHAFADMIGADALKTLAASKLQDELSTSWVSTLFPRIVEEVYSTTSSANDKIREVVADCALKHMSELKEVKSFNAERLDFAGFWAAIAMRTVGKMAVCPGCSKQHGLGSGLIHIRCCSNYYQINSFV